MLKEILSTAICIVFSSVLYGQSYFINPNEDASVNKNDARANFGGITTWGAEFDKSSNGLERSFMQIDLSSLPSNQYVQRAYLTLVGDGHTTNGDAEAELFLIKNNWDESTVTWDNQPSVGSTHIITLDAPTTVDEKYTIDVTQFINEMYENPGLYYGIAIRLRDEDGSGTYRMHFISSDGPADVPELEVIMTPTPLTASLNQLNSKLVNDNNGPANIDIDVNGGSTPYSFSWSPGGATTEDLSNVAPGSYTVTITDYTGHQRVLQFLVRDDTKHNWIHVKRYDENGGLIGESKEYSDNLGRMVQSMQKDLETGRVMATHYVYDAHGREAVTTLPAPSGDVMVINENFMNNTAGAAYSHLDFDASATFHNPRAVQQTDANTLGHYYSANGPEENVPTTGYPYVRTAYMGDPTNKIYKTALAGDEFRMGKNREAKVIQLYSNGELDNVFGVGKSYKVSLDASDPLVNTPMTTNMSIVAQKILTTDRDGNKSVEYIADGKVIAKAVVRSVHTGPGSGSVTAQAGLYLQGPNSTEVHLPRYDDQLSLPLPDYIYAYEGPTPLYRTMDAADISFDLYDIETDMMLSSVEDYTLDASSREVTFKNSYLNRDKYLRVTVRLDANFLAEAEANNYTIPITTNVFYRVDYSHWIVYYYDLAGRLRRSVSAEGFVAGGNHTMYTNYDYDSYGNQIAVNSPDEGKTEMVYDSENRLRFSQNAVQRSGDRFSYTHYDEHSRVVESGEYTTPAAGIKFQNYYEDYSMAGGYTSSMTQLNERDGLNDADCGERSFIAYYKLDAAHDFTQSAYPSYSYSADYVPYYQLGQISKTWDEHQERWFGYDLQGRLSYLVQKINDADYSAVANLDDEFKTLDIAYDNGLVLTREYQKFETAEYLKYTYAYDANRRLSKVEMEDYSQNSPTEVNYEYYMTGRLKRKVLGYDYQGVDYTYTINGNLKGINHPSLDTGDDPGQDGQPGSANSSVQPDLFGLFLDYHEDDFLNSNSNVTTLNSTNANQYYNGRVSAIRWKIRDREEIHRGPPASPVALYSTSTEALMYKYSYDFYGRLGMANFGIYDSDSEFFTERDDYKVSGGSDQAISYDDNGNIQALERKGYETSGGSYDMDDLTYTYDNANNRFNRLTTIEDNVVSSGFGTDFSTGGPASFTYDAMGRLTESDADDVSNIDYNLRGQVAEVTFSSSGHKTTYHYDASQRKIRSEFYDSGSGDSKYSWYVYDESGRVMAIYQRDMTATPDEVKLQQQPLYGSARIGVMTRTGGTEKVIYELKDHLANVRVAFSWDDANSENAIESWADYYPFGEVLPGRNSTGSHGYQVGYQGQEKAENQKWYNFQLRMYNASTGRFLSPDPYGQFFSPYLAMANDPVSYVDPDGGYASAPNGAIQIRWREMQIFNNTLGYASWAKKREYQSWLAAKVKKQQDMQMMLESIAMHEEIQRRQSPFGDFGSDSEWHKMADLNYTHPDIVKVKIYKINIEVVELEEKMEEVKDEVFELDAENQQRFQEELDAREKVPYGMSFNVPGGGEDEDEEIKQANQRIVKKSLVLIVEEIDPTPPEVAVPYSFYQILTQDEPVSGEQLVGMSMMAWPYTGLVINGMKLADEIDRHPEVIKFMNNVRQSLQDWQDAWDIGPHFPNDQPRR